LLRAPVCERFAAGRTRRMHVVAQIAGPADDRPCSRLVAALTADAIPSSHRSLTVLSRHATVQLVACGGG
jgi:hypothetical protein